MMSHGPDIPSLVQSMKAMKDQFEGIDAIYLEGEAIARVHLSNINIDDWGISATVTPIPTLGLDSDLDGEVEPLDSELDLDSEMEPWDIAASWEIFSFSSKYWDAAYVAWTIYFDHDLVSGVLEKSAKYSAEERLVRYAEIMDYIQEYEMKEYAKGVAE